MRRFLKPHVGVRATETRAILAHWKCDEVSAAGNLADSVGSYMLTANNSPGVAASLYATPAGTTGARTLNGTDQYFSGVADAAARAVFRGNYALTLNVRFDTMSSRMRVFQLAGNIAEAPETEAENILCIIDVIDEVYITWEYGSGTQVEFNTTGANLDVDTRYLIALVVRDATDGNAAHCDADILVFSADDLDAEGRGGLRFFESFINLTRATGGTNANFDIGHNTTTPSYYLDGTLGGIAIWKYPLTKDAVALLYAETYGIDHDEELVYEGGVGKNLGKLLVEDDNGSWIDYSSLHGLNFVKEIEWGRDVDDQGWIGSATLYRSSYDLNLSPGVTASRINVDAGGTALQITRRAKIYHALVPQGMTRDDVEAAGCWVPVLDGFITDIDEGDPSLIKLELFDKVAALQDVWVEPDRTVSPPVDRVYGSSGGTALQGELQDIIDDSEPAVVGYKGGKPTIYVRDNPGWNVYEFPLPPSRNVAEAEEFVVGRIGWQIGYRWDDEVRDWRYTLWEPERTKTWASGDPEFAAGRVLASRKLSVSRDDIRNYVDVEFGDRTATDSSQTYQRNHVSAQNTTSRDKYGHRGSRIGIDSTSPINESTQAQTLADNFVSDLAEPKAVRENDVALSAHIDIEDMARFYADGIWFDTDQDFAVVAVRSRLSATAMETTLTSRGGKPAGKISKWWDFVQDVKSNPGKGLRGPKDPASVIAAGVVGGVKVSWAWPTNNLNKAYKETEIHASASSGFTPSSSTLIAIVRGKNAAVLDLAPGDLKYIKVVHRDSMGNVSAASSQVSATPAYVLALPAGRCYAGSTQALTASLLQRLLFDTEDYDRANNFSNDGTRTIWTAPVSGVYRMRVRTKVVFSPVVDSSRLEARKNGDSDGSTGTLLATTMNNAVVAADAATYYQELHGEFWLAAGDTVVIKHLYAKASSATLQTGSDASFWEMALVSQ